MYTYSSFNLKGSDMFEHLIGFSPEPSGIGDFVAADDVAPVKMLDAQVNTANWLSELGVPSDEEIDEKQQQKAARDAFTAMAVTDDADTKVKEKLARLKTPPAVQQLAGMLCAYDWEFIEQAKDLRGYTVAKIVEETKHPDARIRLKALQMLGNVTEVALFTERVEVKKVDATEEEIESRLRDRLSRYLKPVEYTDVEAKTPEEPPKLTLDDEISAIAEVGAN